MQEPVFLLVLMVMTALGVRVFLGQLHGAPLRLPRLQLPRPALPRLPGHRRPKRAPGHPQQDGYPADDDYEAGSFAAGRSPFVAAAPAPGTNLMRPPAIETADAYENEDDDEAYLPASQVDFFASDDAAVAPPIHRVADPRAANAAAPAAYASSGDGSVVYDSAAPPAEASPVHEVAVEPEPNPNDIMSFFEKPDAVTQVPQTLRDDIEKVSAVELLAEARQLRALLHRDSA